jgi:hypothetical protein
MPSLNDLEAEYAEMNFKNGPVTWTWVPDFDSRCLAISTLGQWTLDAYTWTRFCEWIQPLLTSGIMYTPTPKQGTAQLHWTLQQCQPFTNKLEPSVIISENLTNRLEKLAGIELIYRGLVLTPSGIALQGFPKNEYQYEQIIETRQALPAYFNEMNVDYKEPYKNTICHATVFRWTAQPSEQQIDYVLQSLHKWSEARFATLKPYKWIIGRLNLKVLDSIIYQEIVAPLRIAHRGLRGGPNEVIENTLRILEQNCADHVVSECDLWFLKNEYWLGHNAPLIYVDINWIKEHKQYLLLHAKTIETFHELQRLNNSEAVDLHVFYHTEENIVLTTSGVTIVYPGKPILEGWMSMMPERAHDINKSRAAYICSDFERI